MKRLLIPLITAIALPTTVITKDRKKAFDLAEV